jgi:hypothetical protein
MVISAMSSSQNIIPDNLLTNTFIDCSAYYLTEHGDPWLLKEELEPVLSIREIYLFNSKPSARRYLREMKGYNPTLEFEIAIASDQQLLELILQCDIIYIDSEPYIASMAGLYVEQQFCDDELKLTSLENIRKALSTNKHPQG